MTAGRPSAQRLAAIAELAEVVAEHHGSGLRTDPVAILRAKGITISFNDYGESFDGMLEHRLGKFHVYCNLSRVERPDSPRARFTLCHELGHYFIDEHRSALASGRAPAHPSVCDYESENPIEVEADTFAANLIMPAGRFRGAAGAATRGLKGVLELSSRFETSITSAAIRYSDLGLLPCMILKFNREGLEWRHHSNESFRAMLGKPVTGVRFVPPDSATGRALRGDSVAAPGVFRAPSVVSVWFPGVAYGSPKNVVLVEEAVPLGRYGVLTLLHPEAGAYAEHR